MQASDKEIAIGGTLQQKISSCLKLMDTLMLQDHSIVASMIVAEKVGGSGNQNIIEAIATILGILDAKAVSPHTTLAELGMDSMMGVEVKQTLERDYDIAVTAQDLRTLTFAK